MSPFIAQTTAPVTDSASMLKLLYFGGAALVVFAGIYWFSFNRDSGRRSLNVTFSRLYGLITVAVLGVALGFANITEASRTAAFTLLGTVAGYLAGAKATEVTQPGDSGTPPEVESIL